MEAVKYC